MTTDQTVSIISAASTALAALCAAGALSFGVYTYHRNVTRQRCAFIRDRLRSIDSQTSKINDLLIESTWITAASAIADNIIKIIEPDITVERISATLTGDNNEYAIATHNGLSNTIAIKTTIAYCDELEHLCASLREDLPVLSVLLQKCCRTYITDPARTLCSNSIFHGATGKEASDEFNRIASKHNGNPNLIRIELIDFLHTPPAYFMNNSQRVMLSARIFLSTLIETHINTTDAELSKRSRIQSKEINNIDHDSQEFVYEATEHLLESIKNELPRDEYEKLLKLHSELSTLTKQISGK